MSDIEKGDLVKTIRSLKFYDINPKTGLKNILVKIEKDSIGIFLVDDYIVDNGFRYQIYFLSKKRIIRCSHDEIEKVSK